MDEARSDTNEAVPRAAIRDIASQAGVSIATVSRVLNGRPDVAHATRDLVMEHVRRLGYVSNRSARALASGRTGLVALTVPFPHAMYFAEIIEGVTEALFERDARVVLCPTHHLVEREMTVLDRLMPSATDGSLLILPSETRAELRQLKQRGRPMVVIDPSTPVDEDIPVVTAANWSGAKMATEHLIALGHRRIGVISGPRDWNASADRLAGYHSALLAAGLPIVPALAQEADFKIEGGQKAAHQVLALAEPPTAIFAMNDNMALGVLRAAVERGLEVPRDLSVVGFDNVELASIAFPALTTVVQPLQEIGRIAVTLLYRQIDGQALDASRIELSTRLVVRDSTAPPPPA